MRRYACILIAISLVNFSFAQGTFKKNDIYLEAGGSGLFGSVNYERQLTRKPGLGARFGVGFYTEKAFYLTIPVGLNYLFQLKNEKAFIEAGLGVTWARRDAILKDARNTSLSHFTNFIPGIGYRRHTTRNVMWRVGAYGVINDNTVVPWLGASIGKRF